MEKCKYLEKKKKITTNDLILFPFVRKYQYCLALSLARCQIPHNKILLMKTLKPKSYIKSTEQSEEY